MLDSLEENRRVVTIFGTDKSDIMTFLSKGDSFAEETLKTYELRAK